MGWLEVILECHIDLPLEQLIICILVPNTQQHVVALQEELLGLLVSFKIVLFLNLDGILSLADFLLHILNFNLHGLVTICLRLDLLL